jgi:hypothetical protein
MLRNKAQKAIVTLLITAMISISLMGSVFADCPDAPQTMKNTLYSIAAEAAAGGDTSIYWAQENHYGDGTVMLKIYPSGAMYYGNSGITYYLQGTSTVANGSVFVNYYTVTYSGTTPTVTLASTSDYNNELSTTPTSTSSGDTSSGSSSTTSEGDGSAAGTSGVATADGVGGLTDSYNTNSTEESSAITEEAEEEEEEEEVEATAEIKSSAKVDLDKHTLTVTITGDFEGEFFVSGLAEFMDVDMTTTTVNAENTKIELPAQSGVYKIEADVKIKAGEATTYCYGGIILDYENGTYTLISEDEVNAIQNYFYDSIKY